MLRTNMFLQGYMNKTSGKNPVKHTVQATVQKPQGTSVDKLLSALKKPSKG